MHLSKNGQKLNHWIHRQPVPPSSRSQSILCKLIDDVILLAGLRKQRQRQKQRSSRNRHRKTSRIRRATATSSSEELVDELLANALKSNSLKAYANQRQAQCVYRLYDNCTNPNCNLRCPTYINLFSSDNKNSNRQRSGSGAADNSDIYNAGIKDLEKSVEDPVVREEIVTRQRWLARATCKQLFHVFYYGSLRSYIGLSKWLLFH